MRAGEAVEPCRWNDAVLAAALFAVDPVGFAGISLRARSGPIRERWLRLLREFCGPLMRERRIPAGVTDDRLLGSFDFAATLRAGRPVALPGILTEADGGVVLLAMAERVGWTTAAYLARALDTSEVVIERDGVALRSRARIGVVALDEGIGAEEGPPAILHDRLALLVDLSSIGIQQITKHIDLGNRIPRARDLLSSITVDEPVATAFCAAAMAVGIRSLRVPLFALRAARAAAALDGRKSISDADAELAARLVIAPRAVCLPETEASLNHTSSSRGNTQQTQPETAAGNGDNSQNQTVPLDQHMGDIVLTAARAAIPEALLTGLPATSSGRGASAATSGRVGALRSSSHRGRPVGAGRGQLAAGVRLHLVETLRAAAPWQKLRRREAGSGASAALIVQSQDIRIVRFKQHTRTVTIFVVDASGSTALNRLAEAKGAIELLLADCYIRRDQVALLAFRGVGADLLLPPTRSLARVKRSLAGLPGGGGTPLAIAIDAALDLATAVQRRGEAPTIVMLTDGRANVARDGTAGRQHAEEDALLAARRLRLLGVPTLVCDVSRRPQPQAQRLAEVMNARYLRLPDANASTLSEAVRGAATR